MINYSEDEMKIGIMGAGNMGAAFARRLAAADHEVAIAARGLDEARKVASQVGHRIRAVPREELAEGTDLLILATPYGASVDALRAVRERIADVDHRLAVGCACLTALPRPSSRL
jgi:8-hydroxy-5-deazaflavin:NADPH oxidoreductase